MKAVLPLLLVLLATAAEPAGAELRTNGPIAAEQAAAPGTSIGTINADGTGPTSSVTAGGADRDAAFSPDGRRLAFTSTRDGNEELYVLELDSGRQTRLTSDPARDHDPAWSPDGLRLAWASERDGNSELYVMPAAGGAASRITFDPGSDQQPAWSSAGAIAFASDRDGDLDLYLVDDSGGGLARITDDPGLDADPSWSPAGTRLAYTHEDGPGDLDVFAIDANGGNRARLTNSPLFDHFPAWSPDGTRIAFASERFFASNVLVMRATGETAAEPAEFVFPGTDPSWGPLPAAAVPERGRTVTVEPESARVLVAPATREDPVTAPVLQVRLRTESEIPVRSTIDATRGTVAIEATTTTPDGPGTVGRAVVDGGVFSIEQADAAAAEPTLRLDPSRLTCGLASAARPADGAIIRIRTRGRFRSVTGYGRGAGRGTRWTMHARCDGTVFKVNEGLVLVTDFRRGRTIRVRAGRCYLAAARRRADALRPSRTCPRLRPPR